MPGTGMYPFSDLLRGFRQRERISQQQLATKLGVHRNTILAWERGDYLPQTSTIVRELTNILHLDEEDTAVLFAASANVEMPSAPIWNLPLRRNPFFTGREAELQQLARVWHIDESAALAPIQAISGLGGIGKTQTALEYVYRSRTRYQAALWVRAETWEALISDLVFTAKLLHLPEQDEQEQDRVIAAVKRWLSEHTQWLLILDNIEDLTLLNLVLPTTPLGHILLTTRTPFTGTLASPIELKQMEREEGALLLLHRAKLLVSTASVKEVSEELYMTAIALSHLLDGLPLALDQAGAYIEETGCSLSDYLKHYQNRRTTLLNRRGSLSLDHPESVSTTFSLSFERVERANPLAADLLGLCAFLAPDAIPEEIITRGASELGSLQEPITIDPIALDDAFAVVRYYSLLHRNALSKTLSMHRLVQAVLKDRMNPSVQRQWAEYAIRAVNGAFPDGEEVATWPQCQRYLPQVEACVQLIESLQLPSQDAGRLLNEAGTYLWTQGQYTQAETLLCKARDIRLQVLGADHLDVAESLNDVALLYYNQGRYSEAEPLYLRSLAIREEQLDPHDITIAEGLNNLALLYGKQGRYHEAESLYLRSLAIYEQQVGCDHPRTGGTLSNLAVLYRKQGRYHEAESLYLRSLAIHEHALGCDHPLTAYVINNLAQLYRRQGRYSEAEPLHVRALAIHEQGLGADHPRTALDCNNLAQLYAEQDRYSEAEPLYMRALAIHTQQMGRNHPDTALILHNIGRLYSDQQRYTEAESFLLQALTIDEQRLGVDHPKIVDHLMRLAQVYMQQRRYDETEPLFRHTLAIQEKVWGQEHAEVATALENYAEFLRKTNRGAEAETYEGRARLIRDRYTS